MAKVLDDLPDVLYVDELARFLRMSDRAVRHHIDRGRIRALRLGYRIIIPKRAVEEFLNGEVIQESKSRR